MRARRRSRPSAEQPSAATLPRRPLTVDSGRFTEWAPDANRTLSPGPNPLRKLDASCDGIDAAPGPPALRGSASLPKEAARRVNLPRDPTPAAPTIARRKTGVLPTSFEGRVAQTGERFYQSADCSTAHNHVAPVDGQDDQAIAAAARALASRPRSMRSARTGVSTRRTRRRRNNDRRASRPWTSSPPPAPPGR